MEGFGSRWTRSAPWAAVLAMVVSLVPAGPPPAAGSVDGPPNVLLVVTDDQRATGTVTRLNMPSTRTWLWERGRSFPNAFATTPLCCPGRASIMTGRYAHNHQVRTNNAGPDGPDQLDHETTLQYHLGQAGYRTGIFGKYFNSWDLTLNPPHFDDWAIFRNGYHDATFNVFPGELREIARYSTDFIARRTLRFLDASEDDDSQPWFAYVAPFAPHVPATPKEADADAPATEFRGNPAVFEADRSDKPPYITDIDPAPFSRWQKRARQQGRTLMAVDDLIEDVLQRLRALHERRDTLLLFVSDNGYMWGEHGRGGKSAPYTESIRIPLAMRWPTGGIVGGSEDDRLVANIDIAPTIYEAAGMPVPSTVDGRSLLDGSWARDRLLLEQWNNRKDEKVPDWGSLRTPAYQYVEYYDFDTGEISFREYYELVNDPWQLENLLYEGNLDQAPPAEEIAQLSVQLARDGRCEGTTGPNRCP